MLRKVEPSFQPQSFGHGKLLPLLEKADFLEIRRDSQTSVSVRMPSGASAPAPAIQLAPVRVIHAVPAPVVQGAPAPAGSTPATTTGNRPERPARPARSRPPRLFDWAYFPNFDFVIETLRSMALEETWEFGDHGDQPSRHPILRSFLRWTFHRLWMEGKISEFGTMAAFNTGLVDHRYEPIYAICDRNRSGAGNRPWYFRGFCIAGEDTLGKALVRTFNPLPASPHYFQRQEHMFYDLAAPAPIVDWEHIIVENNSRLPAPFRAEHCPAGFSLREESQMTIEERDDYTEALRAAFKHDAKTYRQAMNRISDAITLSLKRVRWNFKTAIPQYYPTRNQMCLLLPLALINDQQVDLALVVERMPSGAYQGHTILPLDWAYMNARLVCRPDSDWLAPKEIQQTGGEADEAFDEEPADLRAAREEAGLPPV
jgi:hypothetical protein